MKSKNTYEKKKDVSNNGNNSCRIDAKVFVDGIWKEFSQMWKLKYGEPARRYGKVERICFDWYQAGYFSGACWDLE